MRGKQCFPPHGEKERVGKMRREEVLEMLPEKCDYVKIMRGKKKKK